MENTCIINGKNLFSEFKAELSNWTTSSGDLELLQAQPLSYSEFSFVSNKALLGKLNVELLLESDSTPSVSKLASKLVSSLLGKASEITCEDNNFYGVLAEFKIKDTEIAGFCWLNLEFDAIRRDPLVTQTLANGSGTVNNTGSLPTGVRLEVASPQNLEDVEVMGITIKKLKANTPFVIDGITGKVVENEFNAFLNTNLVNFPKLKAGENLISSSKPVKLQVSYYPVDLL